MHVGLGTHQENTAINVDEYFFKIKADVKVLSLNLWKQLKESWLFSWGIIASCDSLVVGLCLMLSEISQSRKDK